MKKFIVLFLAIVLFLLGSYFAYDKHFRYLLPKEYKNEINALLEKEIPKVTQELDELPGRIEIEKDPFDKEILIDMGVNIILFDFYSKIIHITNEYKDIENEIPPTDFNVDLAIAIHPYLKKNKINLAAIKALLLYSNEKELQINKKYRQATIK